MKMTFNPAILMRHVFGIIALTTQHYTGLERNETSVVETVTRHEVSVFRGENVVQCVQIQ